MRPRTSARITTPPSHFPIGQRSHLGVPRVRHGRAASRCWSRDRTTTTVERRELSRDRLPELLACPPTPPRATATPCACGTSTACCVMPTPAGTCSGAGLESSRRSRPAAPSRRAPSRSRLTIDAQYVVGFNWTRNPQLRFVKLFGDKASLRSVLRESASELHAPRVHRPRPHYRQSARLGCAC